MSDETALATAPAPPSPPSSALAVEMLAIIKAASTDPNVDVAKMESLLNMQERIMNKQAEIDFNQAMERLAGKLPRITKDGEVTYEEPKGSGKFKLAFKFASYDNIDRVIRPFLQEEGMSLSFTMQPKTGDGGGMIVTGTLRHKGGHSQSASIPVALDTSGGKNNTQAAGSSFSYGKRYATVALLNLTMEGADDDGVASGVKHISAAQAQDMAAMMTETNTNPENFLRMFEYTDVSNVDTRDFNKMMNFLNAKKRRPAQ